MCYVYVSDMYVCTGGRDVCECVSVLCLCDLFVTLTKLRMGAPEEESSVLCEHVCVMYNIRVRGGECIFFNVCIYGGNVSEVDEEWGVVSISHASR